MLDFGLRTAATCGEPETLLKWRSKSPTHIAEVLHQESHQASDRLMVRTLEELGTRLQANKKVEEGGAPPDRDEQFTLINTKAKAFQLRGQLVQLISS